jgi:hypothetical protein
MKVVLDIVANHGSAFSMPKKQPSSARCTTRGGALIADQPRA